MQKITYETTTNSLSLLLIYIKTLRNKMFRNLSKTITTVTKVRTNMTSTSAPVLNNTFETLAVTSPKPFVFHVELSRAKNLNSFNHKMWIEIGSCFNQLNNDKDCRVIVMSGAGKHFTAGIDLKDMLELGQSIAEEEDVARKGRILDNSIKLYQDSISSLERCVKPVIVAVHAACIGAGVDLITAADIRYCTKDAWFQVKEVDIGMAADVGSLQRLPKVIGSQSLVRELCFTARKLESEEAERCGLISKVFDSREKMLESSIELAELIASKSPLAVQTTKQNIIYSIDRTNQEGLDHIREINKLNLQSEDFINACMAQATKGDKPVFSKL